MDKENINDFNRSKNYKRVKNRRNKIKEELVRYKGGKCESCGYDRCINALEFHHLDPNEKDFTVSKYITLSIEKLKKEVDKCMLVCANCHREIHYNEYLERQETYVKNEKSIYVELIKNREMYGTVKIKDSHKYLNECGILDDIKNNIRREDILKKYHINNKTFNKFLCYNNIKYNHRKIVENKPTKEELIKLLEYNSKSSIGRMFGVTCGSVIKWCKKYKIT